MKRSLFLLMFILFSATTLATPVHAGMKRIYPESLKPVFQEFPDTEYASQTPEGVFAILSGGTVEFWGRVSGITGRAGR